MNKNILKHIIRYLLIIAIIILCHQIFEFSSETGNKSSKTSGKVAEIFINTFKDGKNMTEQEKQEQIEAIQHYVRKGAHFSVYMLLGILTMSCAITFKWCTEYKFDSSIMFCFLYAALDELHQRFVPERSGQFTDVCLDTVSSLIGVLIVLSIYIISKKKKTEIQINPKH